MIRVRDDDVILPSSGHPDPFARLVRVHDIIAGSGALHVPAILCGEIRHFPGAVEYVRQKTLEGEMEPQIHGWGHFPYHDYTEDRIVKHLVLCLDWFASELNVVPSKFYTPWGGNGPQMQAAVKRVGLELVDCSEIVVCRHIQRAPEKWRGFAHKSEEDLELFIHWWEGMNRLIGALGILHDMET